LNEGGRGEKEKKKALGGSPGKMLLEKRGVERRKKKRRGSLACIILLIPSVLRGKGRGGAKASAGSGRLAVSKKRRGEKGRERDSVVLRRCRYCGLRCEKKKKKEGERAQEFPQPAWRKRPEKKGREEKEGGKEGGSCRTPGPNLPSTGGRKGQGTRTNRTMTPKWGKGRKRGGKEEKRAPA